MSLLFSNRSYRYLFFATGISNLGDGVAALAVTLGNIANSALAVFSLEIITSGLPDSRLWHGGVSAMRPDYGSNQSCPTNLVQFFLKAGDDDIRRKLWE